MINKELLSAIAISLTFIAFIPYINAIRRGQTKPHIFSWLIWSSTTFIVFLAQLAGGGGAGAWPIGVSGIITLYVALLAYIKKSDNIITRTDCLFLILAIASLPAWYLTDDPFWAVIILTVVDVLGFGPTFIKSYSQPYAETLTFYIIMVVRNLIAIAALQYYSLTTVLFPAAIAIVSLLFILMVAYRRHRQSTV